MDKLTNIYPKYQWVMEFHPYEKGEPPLVTFVVPENQAPAPQIASSDEQLTDMLKTLHTLSSDLTQKIYSELERLNNLTIQHPEDKNSEMLKIWLELVQKFVKELTEKHPPENPTPPKVN